MLGATRPLTYKQPISIQHTMLQCCMSELDRPEINCIDNFLLLQVCLAIYYKKHIEQGYSEIENHD